MHLSKCTFLLEVRSLDIVCLSLANCIFSADETEMVVTWSTLHHITDEPHVEFGEKESHLSHTAKAETTHFTDGTNLYTYRALLTGLKAATQYRKIFF